MNWFPRAAFALSLASLSLHADRAWAQEAEGDLPDDPSAQAEAPPEGEAERRPPPRPEVQIETQADDTLDRAARQLFEQGSTAFQSGDYGSALELFKRAFELSPRPLLVYNVAVCYDRLRQDERALEEFVHYMELEPEGRYVGDARLRVQAIRASLDEREAQRQAAEAERQAQLAREAELRARLAAEQRDGIHPAFFLTAAGLTAVAGAILVWSGVNAIGRGNDYEEGLARPGILRPEAVRLYDDAHSAEVRTNILIGVTAGLAATSVALLIFTGWTKGEDDQEVAHFQLQPSLSPGMAGLVAGGTF